jgi:hypothetical protein
MGTIQGHTPNVGSRLTAIPVAPVPHLPEMHDHGDCHQVKHSKEVSVQHELISQDVVLDEGPRASRLPSRRQTSHQDGSRSEREAAPYGMGYRLMEAIDSE